MVRSVAHASNRSPNCYVTGSFYERRSRHDDDASDSHVGIALLPPGQRVCQRLFSSLLQIRPLETRKFINRGVTPRMDRHEFHAAASSLVERDRGGLLRCL